MKRFVSLLLSALLLITALPVLGAQAVAIDENHKHKWSTVETVPATCTETGWRYDVCEECWEGRTVTTPALGHYFPNPWKTIIEPTCTEVGREMNTCARVNYGQVCGYEWWRDIPALGHDWSDWYVVKEAKVGAPGIEERKCNRCGITEQRSYEVTEENGIEGISLFKTESSTPANGSYYVAGEEAVFTLTVENSGEVTLYNVQVLEHPDTSEEYRVAFFESMEPGFTRSYEVKHTVTQEDCEQGYYYNEALAIGFLSPEEDGETFTED